MLAGCDLDWEHVQPTLGQVVELPGYPWQRKRIGSERARRAVRFCRQPVIRCLGRRIPRGRIDAEIFEASSENAQTWLVDHRIFGRLLVPAAAVLETLAVAARHSSLDLPQRQLTGFAMHRPLSCPSRARRGETRWQVVVKQSKNGRAELEWHQCNLR